METCKAAPQLITDALPGSGRDNGGDARCADDWRCRGAYADARREHRGQPGCRSGSHRKEAETISSRTQTRRLGGPLNRHYRWSRTPEKRFAWQSVILECMSLMMGQCDKSIETLQLLLPFSKKNFIRWLLRPLDIWPTTSFSHSILKFYRRQICRSQKKKKSSIVSAIFYHIYIVFTSLSLSLSITLPSLFIDHSFVSFQG